MFKNITFSDVGGTLCNESHKSLDCPSLRSIIEMEVSSSASPNDSSSSSDSRSHSPNHDYGSCRCRYFTGLDPHLDHPYVLIGVTYLRQIIVMVEITVTCHQIEIMTIEIDSTILVITVGDIITQIVSPQIGAIFRIIIQINIKTGKFKAATRVVIRGPAQKSITMRVMDGTRGLNVVGKISTEINCKIIRTIILDMLIIERGKVSMTLLLW